MNNFYKAFSDCGLLELPDTSSMFTWSCGKGLDMILKRLDRYLASSVWFELFPHAMEHHLIHQHSGHCLILLTTSPPSVKMYGTNPFSLQWQLDSVWFLQGVVKTYWEARIALDAHDLATKLKSYGSTLTSWSHLEVRDLRSKIHKAEQKLATCLEAAILISRWRLFLVVKKSWMSFIIKMKFSEGNDLRICGFVTVIRTLSSFTMLLIYENGTIVTKI